MSMSTNLHLHGDINVDIKRKEVPTTFQPYHVLTIGNDDDCSIAIFFNHLAHLQELYAVIGEALEQDKAETEEVVSTYKYYVNQIGYETTLRYITGMYIKTCIPGFDDAYALYLEHTGRPDELITDVTTVDLHINIQCFYTVPPCGF